MGGKLSKITRRITKSLFSFGLASFLALNFLAQNARSQSESNESIVSPFKFTDVTAEWGLSGHAPGGHGVAIDDIDNNDYDDILVTRNYGGNEVNDDLFVNHGNNQFSEESAARGIGEIDRGTHGAPWGDLNNDGLDDLAKGKTGNKENNIYRSNGGILTLLDNSHTGLRTNPENTGTRGVAMSHLNPDDLLDLVFGNMGRESELYLSLEDFIFSHTEDSLINQERETQGIAIGDYDNDNDNDLAFAARDGARIAKNDGNAHFSDAAREIGIRKVACDGITFFNRNNDPYLDMAIVGENTDLEIHTSDGNGKYSREVLEGNGYSVLAGDFDNDGYEDLFVAGSNIFWKNIQATNWQKIVLPFNFSGDTRCAAKADLDKDGDLEIIIAAKGGYNVALRNDINNQNSIIVRFNKNKVNPLDAKVLLYHAGLMDNSQALVGYQQITSQQAYLQQNAMMAHFGLPGTGAYDLKVRFFDGTEIVRQNLQPGQTVKVP